jgi:hypothetical protein
MTITLFFLFFLFNLIWIREVVIKQEHKRVQMSHFETESTPCKL